VTRIGGQGYTIRNIVSNKFICEHNGKLIMSNNSEQFHFDYSKPGNSTGYIETYEYKGVNKISLYWSVA
jgi:hypothetical protein